MNDSLQLFFRSEGESMQDRLSECTAWWFLFRSSVVDTSKTALVMAAIGILVIVDNDARVK